MYDVIHREVVFYRKETWLALEGDYWPPLMRLIRAHGLDSSPYEPPPPGQAKAVSADDARALVECLRDLLDDLPKEDLWLYNRDPNGVVDPHSTPPHEFFSGGSLTYLLTLIEMAEGGRFWFWLSAIGTEDCNLGDVHYPIGLPR
jgi:hypothetical protein